MAWEYLDNLSGLTGTPCSFTNGTTWNDFLSYVPSSSYPSTTGDVITLGNIGAYSYQAEYDGQTSIIETSYGLKIEWYTNSYRSNGQSTGGFAVYVYQNNDWHGIAGLYGLTHKGSFRFAVNHELQQAVPVLVRSFYNVPWYSDFNTDLYSSQADKELLYQVLMNGIPSSITEAGAGSGYIGNSLLSNKKMVGYNVPTSSDISTKTESTQYHYSNPSSNCSKIGDGYAKIIFIKSPPDGIIPLLKNGMLKRDDCLVPDPYVSYDNLKTASSVLTASGYEIIAEDDQTTHPLSQASYFQTSLTSNNDPYSSRTFKPLLATNSQDNKYILLNKFKVKFDLEVNIPATDSGFKFKPQLTTHSYYCNLGYYAIGDEFIRSDPNTATTISVQNIETNWIDYEDYNGANANEQPYLTFSLNCSDIAPFYMKLTIKEIDVKLSNLLIPDTIPEVSFNINTTTSGKQGWKINEIYQNIILLGYNSFLLCPISGTSGTTTFYIVAFNLTSCNELYTARDYYIGNSDGYNRFGIETTDTLSGLDIYDADATSSRKILVKRQGSTASFPNTTTKDGHTYLWRQVASYSGRYSYVFYSDCYKKLYINNKFVFEK